MSADPTAGAPAPKKAAPGQRRLLSLALIIVFGVGFGLVAGITFGAWAKGLIGAIGGVVVGLVLAWIVPLFLSVRAALALKRQNRPVLLRRVVAAFLVGLVQVTVFLAGFVNLGQGTATATAEMAQEGLVLLEPVPVIGGMLAKIAKDGGAAVDVKDPKNPTDPKDPPKDPKDPAPVANGLAPRAGGRAIGAFAVGLQNTEGDLAVVVYNVAFGGQLTSRTIDLAAHTAFGKPTRVDAAEDGSAVVVLGGAQLLTIKAGATVAEHDKALSRAGRLGDLEIQQVKDIAVAPGGAVLVTVDAFDTKKNAVVQALVAKPAGGAAFVVRRAGDVLDEAAKEGDLKNVAQGYAIKNNDGSGGVVVEEEFLEGDADVGIKMGGAQWTMNPRRLLVGRIDNPRALSELVRTGVDPSGIENLSLQAFGDAVVLADGRSYFDANAVEEGARGWLFSARSGGGVFAVAPELVGKPEAPFSERAPRTRHFVVDADGSAYAFVTKDGVLLLGNLARFADVKPALKGDAVRASDGSRVGGVVRVDAPYLARGGDWLAAKVELLADGGARKDALLWAGRADVDAGKAEVLLEVGGLVPQNAVVPPPAPPVDDKKPDDKKPDDKKPDDKVDPKATTPTTTTTPAAPANEQRIKSLFFDDGHEELLWQAG
jgi:hypothetical protein